MARQLGSLGDLFPTQDLHCRVRGCPNVWQFSGEDAMHRVASGEKGRPARMCDECFAMYNELQDQSLTCSSKDCEGTWTWTRYQQLEAKVQKRTRPPQGFCDACRSKVKEMSDREVPCRVKGCSKTWTWRSQAQLRAESSTPPPRMCRSCNDTLHQLQDQDVPCRMHGCDNTWRWNRFQQVEHIANGKPLDKPPKRMCKSCLDAYQNLQDRELPCKVDECNKTWTFNAFAQLENRLRNGDDAEPPSKMCKDCYSFFLSARDRHIRCENRGCRNSWIYTKSEQLHDWLQHREAPPQRMCESCQEMLTKAEEHQEPCKIPGCDKTWTYTPLDQVRDHCQGKVKPAPRRCPDCEAFLAETNTQTLSCTCCKAEIQWSAYEQLLCQLGTFVKPERCANCAKQELALKHHEPVPRPHFHVVRMPAGGKWGSDPAIANWPPHLTYDAIEKAENADIRIVAFGDDLTYSSDDQETSWPYLLELKLNEQLQGKATVAVINAGIPKTTSRQAAIRLARDVTPFAPQLVLFSFAFGDSFLQVNQHDGSWKTALDLSDAANSMEELAQALKNLNTSLLYWSSNPILPHDRNPDTPRTKLKAWADAQQNSKNQCLAHDQRVCKSQDIPMLDLRSRFEVNGTKSARKWMKDWFNHNETGAKNIANWLCAHILKEGLLPVETNDNTDTE